MHCCRFLRAAIFGAVVTFLPFAAHAGEAPVVRTEILGDRFAGVLYAPPGRHPGVVVLGGSEGGINEREAAALAREGFCALATGYFKAPRLPRTLEAIPIETVSRAFDVLAKRPEVAGARFAIVGTSKGAELALLAATADARAAAVVAVVPSDVVWFGLPDYSAGATAETSSWSRGGSIVPYIPSDPRADADVGRLFATGGTVRYADVFARSLAAAAPQARTAAEIPVERIAGPVLAIGAEDDAMWDSAGAARRIAARLRAAHHPFADRAITYTDAGHAIVPAGAVPVESFAAGSAQVVLGGTHAGNVAASADSWPRIVTFLREALAR